MRPATTAWSFCRTLIATVTALVVVAVSAASAQAGFGVAGFDGEVVNDVGGTPVAATQAGSHPDEASTTIDFNRIAMPTDLGIPLWMPDGPSVRRVTVDLPVGFVGNPTVAATCTDAQLMARSALTECPLDSQVGIAEVKIDDNFSFSRFVQLWNMVPPDDAPAAFGFKVGGVPIHLRARVRSDTDMGLSVDVNNISQALPVFGTRITLWGVPASPLHDDVRGNCMNMFTGAPNGSLCPSGAPQNAFLTNPTTCNGPVETSLRVTSWRGDTDARTFLTHDVGDPTRLLGPTGCDLLPFDPSLKVAPQTRRASTPAGYTFDLAMPQSESATDLAQSHLKRVVVTLPKGVSVSPPSAEGLGACPDAQAGFGTMRAPECPDASKIGSVTIDTPLLGEPLQGSVYLLKPQPGNLIRLMIAAQGPGVVIKLYGETHPDKVTGQVTATFDNNPQLPFTNLRLVFKNGPRSPLVNPSECGRYTTSTEFTAWNGKTATASSTFDVTQKSDGSACAPQAFNPSFTAGMLNAAAGSSGTFSLTFGRGDNDQFLNDVTVDMPQGLTGVLAAVTPCAEAQAAAGACGEESRVGSVTSGAGAGTNPLYLPGRVYLTGPYKGAPLGLSIVVPAIAGPFDLGVVAVRSALFVDKNTAALRVVADPFPRILEGIPLQIRTINVKIDKPDFMLNPTNCAAKTISGRIGSIDGAAADRSSRFQVGSCSALPFKPKMTLKVGAKGRTKPGITVPFETVVSMTKGQANIRSVRVNLPDNINARLPVINRNACPFDQYQAGDCPASLAIGSATAVTPLLRDPLRGLAYFVRNPARRIPDLVVSLKGQVDVDLTGKVSIPPDLTLATTFDTVPDVPITKFRLKLNAGRSGPIGTIGNLCSARIRKGMNAKLLFKGQNGKAIARTQAMQIAGCARAPKARRGSSKKK
jgi:hypothetical protein